MARYYGSWQYSGGNGMRLVMDVTTSAVHHTSTSVNFYVKFYTENQYRYNDYQTLNYQGSLSGSEQYNNTSGTNSSGGGLVLRGSKTYTYTYSSSSYGSSPGTRNFGAQVTGAYNGVTPSVAKAVPIPARPVASPSPPSSMSLTRVNDSRLSMSWTRNATSGRPYQSQLIRIRKRNPNGWDSYLDERTVSGSSSSYLKTGGVETNTAYEAAVRAQNSAGNSVFTHSGVVGTTPSAPSNVRASFNTDGNSIQLRWQDNAYNPPSPYTKRFKVLRSGDGGAWTTVASNLTGTTWTDSSPHPGLNQYRVEVTVSVPPSLSSTSSTSNSVSAIVPPLAPTNLEPNGANVDLNGTVYLSWQHNDGGDGAEQSHYSVEYSNDGGSTWTPLATNVSKTQSQHTIPAGTLPNSTSPYQWRVSTQGSTSVGFSPWSAVGTFTGSTAPVVTIIDPGEEINYPPLRVTWSYSQAEGAPQASAEVHLLDSETNEVLEKAEVSGAASSYTFEHRPEDSTEYSFVVKATSSLGIDSDATWVFSTVKFPVPVAVTAEAMVGDCDGSVTISLNAAGVGEVAPLVTNYAVNPSVEIDLHKWSPGFSGASLIRDTSRSHSGSSSVKATWSSGSSNSGNAALLQVEGLTVGETYSVSCWVYVPNGSPDVDLHVYFGAENSARVETKNAWTQATMTFQPTTSGHFIGVRPKDHVAGTICWVDDVVIVEGSEPHLEYFDGSTPDEQNRVYSWEGDPHKSRSIATSRTETDVVSAIVERRVGATGEWVTLATDVDVPGALVDPLPSTSGETEYRITSVSSIPSYRVNDPFIVQGFDGHWRENAEYWGFLSWGNGFRNTLRVQDELRVKEETERARAVQPFLGRSKPIAMTGANTQRTVSVSGALFYDEQCLDPDPCEYSSRPEAWLEAGQEAVLVCWRDYTGRRVFGSLSPVQVEDGSLLGTGAVSFNVTETDYTEWYE